MNHTVKTVILVCFAYLLFGCVNNSENKIKIDQIYQDVNKNAKQKVQSDYSFEPDISVIIGTLKVETFFGPPGYGENPKTDLQEASYILYPDSVINVIQKSKSEEENGFDVTTENVIKIQLAPTSNISLHVFINKRIKVTGSFYGKENGHHHTDVLLLVTKVEGL